MAYQTVSPGNPTNHLRILLPNGKDEYVCTKSVVKIGKDKSCDLCFPGIRTLSTQQAAIFYRKASWYIRNISSSGDILVNGQRLPFGAKFRLSSGDKIQLGANVNLEVLPLSGNGSREARFSCMFCGYEITPGQRCPMCGEISNAPSYSGGTPESSPKPTVASVLLGTLIGSVGHGAFPSTPSAMLELLAKGFGSKKVQKPAPSDSSSPVQPVLPQSDDVQFRGAAPQNIRPGEYFNVKIMMYREDDYQRADRETAAVAAQAKEASSGIHQAKRGEQFRIVLQSPDLDLDSGEETLVWNGIFATADFEVFLPENYDRKQLRLRGRVYSGDAVLTDLKLILQICAAAPQQVVCEKVNLQTAFVSYASADREKVVARLQGVLLGRPDMDLFFDVESLRRGEAWEPRLYQEISRRDLFYLFWSRNAAASSWVHKELDYAVHQKTLEFIEPVPLESPDICPPPAALICKHFNDWTLRYLQNK